MTDRKPSAAPLAADNALSLIGNTPMVRLNRVVPTGTQHEFYAKLEFFSPGLSVKDRIAEAIVRDAEKSGRLKPGGTLVEATSGNTGVGLAMVAAVRGYRCVFVMPEKISEEKRATLRAYGSRVVITPSGVAAEDSRSHYCVAERIARQTPGAVLANQYHNPVNPIVHEQTTGPEIWAQLQQKVDAFVAGAGTGGTISGVGRYLRRVNPQVRIVCADPFGSILDDVFINGKITQKPGSYLVEGIGEDMIPKNVHFDQITDFVKVDDRESFGLCRRLAQEEGLLVGPSCGSALAAAWKFSQQLKKPSRIVALFADSGRGYLSKAFNEIWLRDQHLLETDTRGITASQLCEHAGDVPFVDSQLLVRDAVRACPVHSDVFVVREGRDFIGVSSVAEILRGLRNQTLRWDDPILVATHTNLPEVPPDMELDRLQTLLSEHSAVRVSGRGTILTRGVLLKAMM